MEGVLAVGDGALDAEEGVEPAIGRPLAVVHAKTAQSARESTVAKLMVMARRTSGYRCEHLNSFRVSLKYQCVIRRHVVLGKSRVKVKTGRIRYFRYVQAPWRPGLSIAARLERLGSAGCSKVSYIFYRRISI